MRARFLALVTVVGVWGSMLFGAPAAAETSSGDTVVSFTFDGTYKGQSVAAEILAEHGMAGTFYVNSGYLDYPAFLSVDQLRTIARNRSEIGGASLLGEDLSTMSEQEARAQICDDRTTLAQLGFQVTSFAHPHGAGTAQVKAAAQACGYNSGRDLAGLYESPSDCSSCPKGETLPPTDDFRIRTAGVGNDLDVLKSYVVRAEESGGGWVPLVFSYICVCPELGENAISPEDFTAFVRWMETRPDTTQVMTVDQVMEGELKPVVGTPLKRLVPDPSPVIGQQEALSRVPAWTLFGVGIGQAQLLFVGVVVTVAVVLTYRTATRGNRYAR